MLPAAAVTSISITLPSETPVALTEPWETISKVAESPEMIDENLVLALLQPRMRRVAAASALVGVTVKAIAVGIATVWFISEALKVKPGCGVGLENTTPERSALLLFSSSSHPATKHRIRQRAVVRARIFFLAHGLLLEWAYQY